MALTTVNSDGVKDDSIKNIDVKSDAAIAGSKINPAFTTTSSIEFSSDNSTVAEGLFLNNTAGNTGDNVSLAFSTDSGNRKKSAISHVDEGPYGRGSLTFSIDGADTGSLDIVADEKFRINYDGNIGIGTTSPDSKLDIEGSGSPELRITDTTNTVGAYIQSNNTKAIFGSRTNHPIQIEQNAGAALYIDTSKNVGIGTTSPDGKLDVRGTILVNGDGTGGRIFASSGNLSLSDGNGRQIFRIDDPGSGNSHNHIFDSNGRFGIGTISPIVTLDVNGEIALPHNHTIRWHDGGTTRVDMYGDGSNNFVIRNNSGNAISTLSSAGNLTIPGNLIL